MNLIATTQDQVKPLIKTLLEGYEAPAILVSKDYVILATNQRYSDAFGEIETNKIHHCYQVSHGYNVPCDQAGESCPLDAAIKSGHKERVLHIHQTPRGREHVDVEMLPILNDKKEVEFFIELLKPVPLATGAFSDKKMIGESKIFNQLIEKITRVGKSNASVLLLGESGTGKELAARAIHIASDRKDKPLVTLECSGLTDSLFESELFGHVKGAFTGAHTAKKGLVELAEGGTLFLDEIADVPLHIQVKLLRLIESHTFRSVGSAETKKADFRLICATHKNIAKMVDKGSFRQDLYYRINVFPIYLPSLRERSSDISAIAKHLIKELSPGNEFHLMDSAIKTLTNHEYKGNVRELRNILMRAIVLADTNIVDQNVIIKSLEGDSRASNVTKLNTVADQNINIEDYRSNSGKNSIVVSLKENEKEYFRQLMIFCDNDKNKAAEIAGISLRSLYRKLEQFENKN